MKVLQTLGHRNGFPPTPFYYRREADGIRIESIVGKKIRRLIDTDVWNEILRTVFDNGSEVFGVSSSANSELDAPKLHDLIKAGSNIGDTRTLAYISAVLVHEGSLILDHGPRQDDLDARIFLRRSTFTNVDYASRHPES
ncbi:hypothetical protein ACFFTN_11890 [Aminobacter aganoensis]|uniref:Uncharacterized protein n=1 Tax=Aminobacter aganoensis TaxID=83264 RepID=A0A7X0F964_9HYPH|nr:hypothetical protein [Aminobacter aganoensis]MBB6355412.1 hypothetical protein [Aminobacter aganoensis]